MSLAIGPQVAPTGTTTGLNPAPPCPAHRGGGVRVVRVSTLFTPLSLYFSLAYLESRKSIETRTTRTGGVSG